MDASAKTLKQPQPIVSPKTSPSVSDAGEAAPFLPRNDSNPKKPFIDIKAFPIIAARVICFALALTDFLVLQLGYPHRWITAAQVLLGFEFGWNALLVFTAFVSGSSERTGNKRSKLELGPFVCLFDSSKAPQGVNKTAAALVTVFDLILALFMIAPLVVVGSHKYHSHNKCVAALSAILMILQMALCAMNMFEAVKRIRFAAFGSIQLKFSKDPPQHGTIRLVEETGKRDGNDGSYSYA